MTWIDSLLNWLHAIWGWVWPFRIVNAWEGGVILRLGRFQREIGPGLRWVWPLGFECEMTTNVVVQTQRLPAQSMTTKDGKPVVAQGIVKFRVKDVQRYLLEVYDTGDAMVDVSCGAILRAVSGREWLACTDTEELEKDLERAVQKEVTRFGIDVMKVTLATLAPMRSLRLVQDPGLSLNLKAPQDE